ncbi:MAG: ABC transporter ATP-binding protein, partial [Candidatus Brocadiae bacterium]|nr:ABC transporter ATP-binding protein [Candidatus Brocadiia bacterium]
MDTIKKLRFLFNKVEKIKFLIIFISLLLGAFLEMFGLSFIAPLVGIISNPNTIHEQKILQYIYNLLGMSSTKDFLLFMIICLLALYIFKNIYLFFMYHIQFKFVYNQQAKFSRRMLQSYLRKPYIFHLQRNTSELLKNVNNEVNALFGSVILSSLLLMAEALIVLAIGSLLLVVAPVESMVVFAFLGITSGIFLKIFRKKIKQAGKQNQQHHIQMIKWVNQGLCASKEVKVTGREDFFVNAYTANSKKFAATLCYYQLMNQIPKLFLETIAIVTILTIVTIVVIENKKTNELFPILALFCMSAFRLMPSINRINCYINSILYYKPSVDVIYKDLYEDQDSNSSYFQKKSNSYNRNDILSHLSCGISIENVSFQYPNAVDYVLKNVSFHIPKGKSVAFIGQSGSGKTTMANIILGLLDPSQGTVTVGGINIHDNPKAWSSIVGYIPQSIYLSDDTIKNNVAFGIEEEKIEEEKVWGSLEKAQLKEFIEKLPDRLNTYIGERGIRLSGGQRQRIGIARALYHEPEVLILDEATSSLDNATE